MKRQSRFVEMAEKAWEKAGMASPRATIRQSGERSGRLPNFGWGTRISRKSRQATEDGFYGRVMKDRMRDLQAEKDALGAEAGGGTGAELDVLLHPNLPELYRRKVAELGRVLDGPDFEAR